MKGNASKNLKKKRYFIEMWWKTHSGNIIHTHKTIPRKSKIYTLLFQRNVICTNKFFRNKYVFRQFNAWFSEWMIFNDINRLIITTKKIPPLTKSLSKFFTRKHSFGKCFRVEIIMKSLISAYFNSNYYISMINTMMSLHLQIWNRSQLI